MRLLKLAAAVILLVLAVLVALLAADVRAWPAALSSGDAVYASSPSRANWTPASLLPILQCRDTNADHQCELGLRAPESVTNPTHVRRPDLHCARRSLAPSTDSASLLDAGGEPREILRLHLKSFCTRARSTFSCCDVRFSCRFFS